MTVEIGVQKGNRWGFILGVALLLLAAGVLPASAQTVSADGWKRHPEVVEIRALYQKANREKLIKVERSEERAGCEGGDLKSLWLSPNGRPRIYMVQGGTDDMAIIWRVYYDQQSNPRFVYVSHNDVRGGSIEYRVYLRQSGSIIYFEKKILSPGSPLYQLEDLLQDFVFRPMKDFHQNDCTR